jgi:hypothetical protein
MNSSRQSPGGTEENLSMADGGVVTSPKLFENATKETHTEGKLPMCLTRNHSMKTYWRSGGMASCILNLGTRWR